MDTPTNYHAATDFELDGHSFKDGDPVPLDIFEPDVYPSLLNRGLIVDNHATKTRSTPKAKGAVVSVEDVEAAILKD